MMRAVVFLLLALPAISQAGSGSFADTRGLLIEYDFRSDGPVDHRTAPLVRVYGDGRLEVAVPWYRRNRGYYVGELSEAELDRLLRAIEQSGVLRMDPEALAQSRLRAKAAADRVVMRSETETTRFAFALAGAKTLQQSTWRNLRLDAELFGKSVEAFSRLWQVDRSLHDLTGHPSLKKVAEMPAAREVAR